MAITGINNISVPTSFGVNATVYRVDQIIVSIPKQEVIVVFKGYASESARQPIDSKMYTITTDLSLTPEQVANHEYIAQATVEEVANIYIPSIDLVYEQILALPEWSDATAIEI